MDKHSMQKRLFENARIIHKFIRKPTNIAIMDKNFTLLPNVCRPDIKEVIPFQLKHLQIDSNSKVLEVGCGSGVLTVFLAAKIRLLVAVDINESAIENTRINLDKYSITNVSLRRSDLFEAIKDDEYFDVILFNPPFFRIDPSDYLEMAWCYKENLFHDFFKGANSHIKNNSLVYVVFSSFSFEDDLISASENFNFNHEIAAKEAHEISSNIEESYILHKFYK